MASSYGQGGSQGYGSNNNNNSHGYGYGSTSQTAQNSQPGLGATFVPGGFDDFYMPAPPPELVSPSPQRIMPEVPEQIQDGLAHLELEANESVRHAPTHMPVQNTNDGRASMTAEFGYGSGATTPRHGSLDYTASAQRSSRTDVPRFSPFPKLQNPPQNVPPSDEDKEGILWDARLPVLNSNDPEMQLAWAQDALAYVDAAMTYEQRIAESQPARAATPQVEHQLRVDAMNIVSFLADQHHPKAEFMRGMWLEFGKFGQRQDKREAYRSYQRASEKGYSRAEYRMGMQFEQSNDPIKALQHYKKGADEGDSASNYRLGMMTLQGQAGQQQDFQRGLQLLKQAAATADENAPQGAYVLGMLQAHELHQVSVPEEYLPYDEKGARANIEKAAYLGFAKAQQKMGSAYELCTLGCEFNAALSLHYYALASRQGEIEADMAISKWFLCGHEGVFQKNDELAFVYAKRAAQAGLANAMFGLGYFYEIGLHIPKNMEIAYEWYEKAAQAGNADATARLEALSNNGSTLSRNDHENVAINRIKSQHGSKRGKRPPKLAAKLATSNLGSMAEEYGEEDYNNSYGHSPRPATSMGALPPRSSSTAPYPMADGPPHVTPLERPATTIPYPEANGQLAPGPGRQSLAGGFAPELRSHTPNSGYVPPRGSSMQSQQPSWQQQQQRPMGNFDTGAGRGGPGYGQNNSRIVSGPPTGYRQPGGPSLDQRPELPPKMPLDGPGPQNPAINIGYSAPPDLQKKQRLQKPVSGGGGAGLQPLNMQKTRPGTGPMGGQHSPSAQQFPPSARPPRGDSHAGRVQSPMSSNGGLPSRTSSAQTGAARPPRVASAATAVGGPQQVPAKKPINRPPGKGPKTFEEMGVPQSKQQEDCVVM